MELGFCDCLLRSCSVRAQHVLNAWTIGLRERRRPEGEKLIPTQAHDVDASCRTTSPPPRHPSQNHRIAARRATKEEKALSWRLCGRAATREHVSIAGIANRAFGLQNVDHNTAKPQKFVNDVALWSLFVAALYLDMGKPNVGPAGKTVKHCLCFANDDVAVVGFLVRGSTLQPLGTPGVFSACSLIRSAVSSAWRARFGSTLLLLLLLLSYLALSLRVVLARTALPRHHEQDALVQQEGERSWRCDSASRWRSISPWRWRGETPWGNGRGCREERRGRPIEDQIVERIHYSDGCDCLNWGLHLRIRLVAPEKSGKKSMY